MRLALLLAFLGLAGCVLDLDRLRGDGAVGEDRQLDAGSRDLGADAADGSDPRDADPVDADAADADPRDADPVDAGDPTDATDPRDAGGPVSDGGVLDPYADVIPSCPTGWQLALEDDFSTDLTGWIAPGRPWHVEGGAVTANFDGLDDYWTNHLYRDGLSVDQVAIVADLAASAGAWPQVHLHLDPAAHTERFLGVRLNDLGDDLHVFRQTAPVNQTDPIAHAALPALEADRTHRWVIALVAVDASRVRVTAGVYPFEDVGPRIGERLEAELTPAEAYSAGSIGFSGWAGDVRVHRVRVYACR